MKPRIVGITGPTLRTPVPIVGDSITIGRRSSNGAVVTDLTASRVHCRIVCNGDAFAIEDLESQNGTFVNGALVERGELHHGDEIRVGSAIFVFLTEPDEPASKHVNVELDYPPDISQHTLSISVNPSEFLFGHDRVDARNLRDLRALLEICSTLRPEDGLEAIEERLLELLLKTIPAKRGAIFLRSEHSSDFSSVFGFDGESSGSSIRVSQSVIDAVTEQGNPIFNNDIASIKVDSDSDSGSLAGTGVRSFLAVPLKVLDKVTGAAYLDTDDPDVKFDERHVELLVAAAGAAAIPLDTARRMESLRRQNERLRREAVFGHYTVGESEAFNKVNEQTKQAATTKSPVWISGESGTGKQLLAREIHTRTGPADAAFILVSCALSSEETIAHELFGYERGAFGGALESKVGTLEIAAGGTIYLEEIGGLSDALQRRVLRLLKTREFERFGSTTTRSADIRLIASSSRITDEAVQRGEFRGDLFYHLNGFRIDIPPLRSRFGDVRLLARYFASRLLKPEDSGIETITERALAVLEKYTWPGNVRELRNVIEQAYASRSAELIDVEDLPDPIVEAAALDNEPVTPYHDAVREARRKLIIQAVDQCDFNYADAARQLGINRTYLHRLVSNLGLRTLLAKMQEDRAA